MKKTYIKFGLLAALLIGGASLTHAQSEAEVAEPASEEDVTQAAQEAVAEVAAEGAALEAEVAEEALVPATEKQLKQVVARVDGQKITLGDVLVVKSETPPQFLQGDDAVVMQTIIEQIAVQRVLAEKAEKSDVLELKIENVTNSTRAQQTLSAYIEENMTDEFVQEKYDEVIGNQPDQTEWDASHILVETEEEAVAVKARLDGGEEFAAVAEEASKDPGSAARGGALGWFGPGQMVPAFEGTVKTLDSGQISEPVQSDFGWHVILLNDSRVAEKPSFEDVEPQLRDFAQSELANSYLETIKSEADIKTDDDLNVADINLILPE